MDYGKNCFLEDCKQLDLLPVECIHCKNTYCKLHYPAWSHNCEKVTMLTTENGPDAPLRPSSYMCTVGECKEKSLVPIYCNSCGRLTCILHKQKESHDCSHLPQVKQEKEVNDNQQIVVVLKEALIQQQQTSSKSARPEITKQPLSEKQKLQRLKVDLIKLRMKAKTPSDRHIKPDNKCYFKFVLSGCQDLHLCLSKNWIVGESFDYALRQWDRAHSKVTVISDFTQQIVDLALSIEDIFERNISVNGDTLRFSVIP